MREEEVREDNWLELLHLWQSWPHRKILQGEGTGE